MSLFQLQQFTIDQSLSGMKICSDSLLFGALIPVEGVRQILDIGTGTGLLSLMQAQKCSDIVEKTIECITAVEITAEGAKEARGNFLRSPWHSLLNIVHQDIQSFSLACSVDANKKYDLIICNPPFFSQHSPTRSSNALRHIARHAEHLTYGDLCSSIARLLTKTGSAYLLLPTSIKDEFSLCLEKVGLKILEIIEISESKNHIAKVMVLKIVFTINSDSAIKLLTTTLYKFNDHNTHTREVRQYLSAFLLRYQK